ncbi:sulfite exporter TauE/SafE family protein [Floccifex sp.]|uniref:sulfite exporter TauE/SafE family protein n=1 Tax=Floccifex sp. TaxID=2815810 RepID=UPI002A74CD26|nr:sulfite exporter TauE/SafE family protein [Floccifex sp.]MDD7280840.1 sulfite exporter TauE/SafE family protein [Erysipelotrichaceae bacterium]MDY2958185.1 sulfite exporter TauE/SafE family protein [Floccifex sp.]
MEYIVYILAGLGAGTVTGLAGLSAAVVITPMLVSLCGWESYNAVTVALAADVLASLLSAYTYYKNKNIDIRRGLLVMLTAFAGTVIGSYVGYLFSQAQPDGLGYISMLTTIFLGIKFILKPVAGGNDDVGSSKSIKDKFKTVLAMFLGLFIGFVCGFTGSGGGILMLTVFTLVLGYNLKIAVGTSTLIMSAVALTGTISHISMGAEIFALPMLIVVAACLLGAIVSSKFANKCEIKKLNRVVGVVLLILGVFTILIKLL